MAINVPERKQIKTTRLKRGSSVWKNPTDLKKDKKASELAKPRITTIIPTHNMYHKVAEAFNSVWRQMSDYDHVIIADRGSKDGTNPGMFPEDERITYIRYPKTSDVEIINFAIINVVQTKWVMLLDPSSQLGKGYLDTIRKSLGSNSFVSGVNRGTDGLKNQVVEPRYSFSGYTFSKNDALKVGLFSVNHQAISSALFIEKMKELGKNLVVEELAEMTTKYNKLNFPIDEKLFEQQQKKHFTDYNDLNFSFSPVSFIWINKQMTFLKDLIDQLKEPGDDVHVLNTFTNNQFRAALSKTQNDTVIVMRTNSDKMFTYDPLTNLRLLHDGSNILKTNMENGVNCVVFNKNQYVKTKGDDPDGIIRAIAKNAKKTIEQTNIIEHKSKVKTEEVVRSGVMIYEKGKTTAETIRKKKGQSVAWQKDKSGVSKLKRVSSPKTKVTRVGIKNYSMKWTSVENLPKIPGIENRRPKILFISDVAGWAWHYKSLKLKEYLGDEFDISICWLIGPGASTIRPRAYDLYVTFGYSYVDYLSRVAPRKKITGITAHRPHSVLVPQMRKAAVVHANSMMLYNELKTMHNIVYYVPNGVDEQLFRPIEPIPIKRKNNDIVVGHVGKLSLMKGQDKYIKPAIKKAGAVGKLHLNDYTNAIPIEEMPYVYQDMDCFIVASKEDGTPNPALEAAACGRPIISNRIGNMPEFIKDGVNGFLVEKEIGAYVEKIRWLKRNRHKMIEMGQKARETVEKGWTWKIQAENYRTMFKEVLGL